MKNFLYLLAGLATGFLLHHFSCNGNGGVAVTSTVTVRDTVTERRTDTLWLKAEPVTVTERVVVVDSNGIAAKSGEIARLEAYCATTLQRLQAANTANEALQRQVGGLQGKLAEVELPANHYEKTARSEKTGVTAKVAFDTYGYVRGDSILLVLDDTDVTIREQKETVIDRTRNRATGLAFGFNQEIGGKQPQRLDLTLYRRANWLTYGLRAGGNVDNFGQPYIGIVAGAEFGQKRK